MSKYTHGEYTKIEKDWSLEENAEEMAERIKQYWKDRGKEVKTWLDSAVKGRTGNGNLFWGVRSDMINGLPK